ncbi:MAG: DUF6481 family protein [Croceibacterium sp.]
MAGYKELDFNERRASAQKARESALAKLKARPPVTEAELARRRAEQEARDAALTEKRHAAAQAKLATEEAAKAAKAAVAEAVPAEPTEAERKAARDSKYAARKKRKAGR